GECYPLLEVYSVDAEGNSNQLFLIPPVDYPIKLDQSNHYRLIFYNEEIYRNWKYSYKIKLKENDNWDPHPTLEIGTNGFGQIFMEQDIIFRYG
ncbi:MAG: hypothetical protein K8S00_14185, partial [Bacteroidales bacterium]|nr:hypothetical protein [Bacteroidales bacterium]